MVAAATFAILIVMEPVLGTPTGTGVGSGGAIAMATPITKMFWCLVWPWPLWARDATLWSGADEASIARIAEKCGLDAMAVNQAHIQALVWAEDIDL